MFRTSSQADSISAALRKLLQGGRGEVKLYASLQQREQAVWSPKISYQVEEFSILCMARCQPLGSLNSFLSYASHLSGANPISLFILLLVFPLYLSGHRRGWQHPLSGSVLGALIHISCLEVPMDRRAWQATFDGVAKSRGTELLTVSLSFTFEGQKSLMAVTFLVY